MRSVFIRREVHTRTVTITKNTLEFSEITEKLKVLIRVAFNGNGVEKL